MFMQVHWADSPMENECSPCASGGRESARPIACSGDFGRSASPSMMMRSSSTVARSTRRDSMRRAASSFDRSFTAGSGLSHLTMTTEPQSGGRSGGTAVA